ncbi:hypothetical protein [Exiguobacterium acetylicum]|uniref:hypothetical protein n=1 Tax=Exiguobacterium acetylicum TaxID=41170 RepID=UPI0027E070DD|nr:hypothetical protein [Exiguobacterium acetylicum]
MKNNFFKRYDSSIFGTINLIGLLLFTIVTALTIVLFNSNISSNYLHSFLFIAIYTVATSNINRCVFPYKKQQPALVFVSEKLMLKHLYFTLRKGYSLQLLLAFSLLVMYLFYLNQFAFCVLIVMTICTTFLSELLNGLFSILFRILLILEFWVIVTARLDFAFLLVILQLMLFVFYVKKVNIFPSNMGLSLIKISTKKKSTGSIFYIFLTYILNNKLVSLIFGSIIGLIIFYCQYLFTKLENLPALILIVINFITILEIVVGQKREEVSLDRSRLETFQASSNMTTLKKFTSSSLYLLTLLLMFLSIFGIIGTVFNTQNLSIIFKGIIVLPMVFSIGVIYFRKTEILIVEEQYNILKYTLPILFIMCITVFSIV